MSIQEAPRATLEQRQKPRPLDLTHILKEVQDTQLTWREVGERGSILEVLEPFIAAADYNGSTERPKLALISDAALKQIWSLIGGELTSFKAVNGVVNVYNKGDFFSKHTDVSAHRHILTRSSPEQALSFLYVASGEKRIDFFMGKEERRMPVYQSPGELYIFQGGTFTNDAGIKVLGLPHEVPPQDVESVTVNWELEPAY